MTTDALRSPRVLVLFTKPARPGRVKTRLVESGSPERGGIDAAAAARLHRAFLQDLMTSLNGGDFELRIAWALDDEESDAVARRETLDLASSLGIAPPASLRQADGDLGDRLYAALAAAATTGSGVAAVGSDHPELGAEAVEEAFDRLRDADVVLGPADDGGYYLIAIRSDRLTPELFRAVPWSTERVLETTVHRCRELGYDVDLLAPAADIDTPRDLAALAVRLEGAERCPRTRRVLAELGRFPGGSETRA